jgi:hypothetical protein
MSNFDENAIRYCDNYKIYGGLKYHMNFPDEWILDELPDTGRECVNCVGKDMKTGYAMWRGIVLGYCSNCAEEYEGKRGPGFYAHGVETYMKNSISVYDTYLHDVDLEILGDPAENPKDTMENFHLMRGNDQDYDYSKEKDHEYRTTYDLAKKNRRPAV